MTDRRDDDFRVRPTFGVAGTLQQRSAELAIVLPGLATQAGKFIGRKHGLHLAPARFDQRNHLIRVDHCFRPWNIAFKSAMAFMRSAFAF